MRWYTRPLCELAEINPRNSEVRSLADEMEVSFIPMAAVSEHTVMIEHPEKRLLATVRKGYTSFKEGDVLFAKITPCMENGKAALATGLLNGIGFGSTEFHVLRARHNIIPKYLFYFVRQASFRIAAKSCMRGAVGQQRVPEQFLAGYQIPFIPTSEQRRIVEILDEADRLRRLHREADAKAARILPALFLKIFGDPATNPMGFPVKPLGHEDICEINPRARLNMLDEETVSFVPMADVDEKVGRIVGKQTRTYGEVKRGFTPFKEGDVLFAKITPCMQNGKAAIACGLIEGIGFGSTEFHVLRAGPVVTPEFLFAVVRLQSFRNQAISTFTGTVGQQRVPAEFLKQYQLPVPPKSEILKFSRLVRQIMATQIDLEVAASKLDQQFNLLLQRAFSGQLTAKWREAHGKELLAEMEQQARLLNLPLPKELEAAP